MNKKTELYIKYFRKLLKVKLKVNPELPQTIKELRNQLDLDLDAFTLNHGFTECSMK